VASQAWWTSPPPRKPPHHPSRFFGLLVYLISFIPVIGQITRPSPIPISSRIAGGDLQIGGFGARPRDRTAICQCADRGTLS